MVAVATAVVWTITFSSIEKPLMPTLFSSSLKMPNPRIADWRDPMEIL